MDISMNESDMEDEGEESQVEITALSLMRYPT
jgi:hypothetical protein